MKNIKQKITVCVMAITLFICNSAYSGGDKVDIPIPKYIKVEFYKLDLEAYPKVQRVNELIDAVGDDEKEKSLPDVDKIDEFVGTAEWKNNKVVISVTDPALEKILKNPYDILGGGHDKKSGWYISKSVTLQPGTLIHLEAIGQHIRDYGYRVKEIERTYK